MRMSARTIGSGIAAALILIGAMVFYLRDDGTLPKINSREKQTEQPNQLSATKGKPVTSAQNDSFEFPFVGRMECQSKKDSIPYIGNNGQGGTLDVKVFYNQDGHFLRAEFFREGSKDYEHPAKLAERNYIPVNERILGVPETPEKASLKKVIDSIRQLHDGKLEKATKFNITRVVLASSKFEEPQEVFIANVFGTGRISDKLPDKEPFKRLRFVLNAEGEVLFVDNVL